MSFNHPRRYPTPHRVPHPAPRCVPHPTPPTRPGRRVGGVVVRFVAVAVLVVAVLVAAAVVVAAESASAVAAWSTPVGGLDAPPVARLAYRQSDPGVSPGPVDANGAQCGWEPPVGAAIVDPFRPPTHRYGPGNRGIEYGVGDGDPVVSVAAGIVGFRGPVAGRLYVVVHHDNGVRSTYGPLQAISVSSGNIVDAGTRLGRARSGFHLTARRGDGYLDPMLFLGGSCGRPQLVPVRAGESS